jgi:hypothetical protein
MNRLVSLIFFLIILACSSKSENSQRNGVSDSYSYSSSDSESVGEEELDDQDAVSEGEVETITNSSECTLDDGNYSALVDYTNDETGYSAQYTLDVDVQDCQIVQINFPNDGYLDEDHINYADIDENGRAAVDGENGKSYVVQILY